MTLEEPQRENEVTRTINTVALDDAERTGGRQSWQWKLDGGSRCRLQEDGQKQRQKNKWMTVSSRSERSRNHSACREKAKCCNVDWHHRGGEITPLSEEERKQRFVFSKVRA